MNVGKWIWTKSSFQRISNVVITKVYSFIIRSDIYWVLVFETYRYFIILCFQNILMNFILCSLNMHLKFSIFLFTFLLFIFWQFIIIWSITRKQGKISTYTVIWTLKKLHYYHEFLTSTFSEKQTLWNGYLYRFLKIIK